MILAVSLSGYYKFASGKKSDRMIENEKLEKLIRKIHSEHPSMGYRRIRDELEHTYHIHVNDKRVQRICRELGIQSQIKHRRNGCTRSPKNPKVTAENVLNRNFDADRPNQKWLTDVTEFKWYEGPVVHKVYLSAILDLYDRRIVAFRIGDINNNGLVFKTFDAAVKAEPFAHPIFHSDRGFQYTNPTFHAKLEAAGMTQSMSRVGKCIDNGPMEGLWAIIKRECYYGNRFTSRESLVTTIVRFIQYYNNRRTQRKLGVHTPMEKHELYYAA